SMENMRAGVYAYQQKLRKLGAKKIGIYIAHQHYQAFNLKLNETDAVWLPHYGSNNGKVNSKPKFPNDIHQYTDKVRLNDYSGPLDLTRLNCNKNIAYFNRFYNSYHKYTETRPTHHIGKRIVNKHTVAVNFYDTPRWKNPIGTFLPKESLIITEKYQV